MNKKTKQRKMINILIIILALVIIISVIVFKKSKRIPSTPIENNNYLKEKKLNLSGFGIFFDEYSGVQKASEVAKKLEEMTTTFIPEVYDIIKYYNDAKIEEYYQNNVDNVRIMFGIDNSKSFKKFAKGLQNAKVDFNEWERLDILQETFLNDSEKVGYAYTEYEVTYKNSTTIKFSLYINRLATEDIEYIINVL